MQVIAEFVETKETFEYLKTLGIDCFQGYYFSPPKEDI
jgi:EAL domain-containing protein (putative c-di-GMP-specific phosphodiesterase class I)